MTTSNTRNESENGSVRSAGMISITSSNVTSSTDTFTLNIRNRTLRTTITTMKETSQIIKDSLQNLIDKHINILEKEINQNDNEDGQNKDQLRKCNNILQNVVSLLQDSLRIMRKASKSHRQTIEALFFDEEIPNESSSLPSDDHISKGACMTVPPTDEARHIPNMHEVQQTFDRYSNLVREEGTFEYDRSANVSGDTKDDRLAKPEYIGLVREEDISEYDRSSNVSDDTEDDRLAKPENDNQLSEEGAFQNKKSSKVVRFEEKLLSQLPFDIRPERKQSESGRWNMAPWKTIIRYRPRRRPALLQDLEETCVPKEQNFDPESRYQTLVTMGKGSCGEVFKSADYELKRTVAIKIVDMESAEDKTKQIRVEIMTLMTCDSPFVPKYYDSFIRGSNLWIVTEFVAGRSIHDVIEEKRLTENEICKIMREVLKGLEYLHQKGIVHRDIKAANILVSDTGDIKLTGFGTAADVTSSTDRLNAFVGTPLWMAPEVIANATLDTKVDIWSLGITAIELAERKPPYADVSSLEAVFNIRWNRPPSLTGNFSSHFKDFVQICLNKESFRRPMVTDLLRHKWIQKAKKTTQLQTLLKNCTKWDKNTMNSDSGYSFFSDRNTNDN